MVQLTINTNQKSRSLPYPKLMVSEKGTIVLFESSETGVVLKGNDFYKLGFYSQSFDMNVFSDFNEAITLQNQLL